MAEIHVEKKSNPWPWIIGLLVLVLVAWAVLKAMDRNGADNAAYANTPVATGTAADAERAGGDGVAGTTNDANSVDGTAANSANAMDPALAAADRTTGAMAPELGSVAGESGATRLYFPLDQAALTDSGRQALDKVVDELRDTTDRDIVLAGYTDTTGTRPYNKELSERRAEAVRAYLVSRGIATSRVTVEPHGQSDLRVDTPNGVAEPENRRVRITFGDES